MSNIDEYLTFAEIALANNAGGLVLGSGLHDACAAASMAESQVVQFDSHWYVSAQEDLGHGLSAVEALT